MTELITINEGAVHARLGARPVSKDEYLAYLHATVKAAPRPLTRGGRGGDAVIYVSQVEAAEYLKWLGEREGARYRLPSTAELLALAEPNGPAGSGMEMWPHSHGDLPERGAVYLCEWTRETETLDPYGPVEPRVLGSVFYPPWLRQGTNPKQVQGMMLASQGYSFVSFRAASDV